MGKYVYTNKNENIEISSIASKHAANKLTVLQLKAKAKSMGYVTPKEYKKANLVRVVTAGTHLNKLSFKNLQKMAKAKGSKDYFKSTRANLITYLGKSPLPTVVSNKIPVIQNTVPANKLTVLQLKAKAKSMGYVTPKEYKKANLVRVVTAGTHLNKLSFKNLQKMAKAKGSKDYYKVTRQVLVNLLT